jgi:two-component system sensor histidine kinase KdpD
LQLDAVLIERVFANLLENASKYTPSGSPIAIAASTLEVGSQRYVKVEVQDGGPGLPVGMEVRLFEKFTRGERESAKPGIGLGLAICRAIVEAHGGSIEAENRLGADGAVIGATFRFLLPVSEAPTIESEAVEGVVAQDVGLGLAGAAHTAPEPPALPSMPSTPASGA